METKTRIYRRSELYEQVWTEPIRKLAPRYGVSDVALAKMCRRLGIPLPGVGHWTKVACGHHIARPPLPPVTIEQPEEIVVKYAEPRVRVGTDGEPLPVVKVVEQVRDPHPLVLKTKMLAKECGKDPDGRFYLRPRGGLDAIVGAPSLSRALKIMDAILKYLENTGYEVGVVKERPFSTYVAIRNQRVAFQLREGVLRTKRPATEKDPYPYPAFNSQPNGVFTLEIKEYVDGERKIWRDGERRLLEEQLGSFVVGLNRAAAQLQAQRERFVEAERERQAEQIRREELETRRREEQRRVDELMQQLSSWQKSEALRRFVAATQAAAVERDGIIEEGSALDNWIKWALRVADRFDPLQNLKNAGCDPAEAA